MFIPTKSSESIASLTLLACHSRGEICFYRGTAPLFGSTKSESGHNYLVWCTSASYLSHSRSNLRSGENDLIASNREVRRELVESNAIEGLKSRMRAKVAEIMAVRTHKSVEDYRQAGTDIPKEYWDRVYLFATDEGVLGLFYSTSSPTERLLPEDRISTFIMAKCSSSKGAIGLFVVSSL